MLHQSVNDFSALTTAIEGGALYGACVVALDKAIKAEKYGRVEAIARMLILLENDNMSDLDKVGLMLADHVFRVIGRELASELL